MTQWGLDNLFNPGKRHMDDEKRRLQSTREEVGDSSGGRRIDLDAGTVSITVTRRGGQSREEALQEEPSSTAVDKAPGPVAPSPAPPANHSPGSQPVPEGNHRDAVTGTGASRPKPRGLSARAWSRRG